MNVSIVIATYGEIAWQNLAQERAYPSAKRLDPYEIIILHDPDVTIAAVRNEAARHASGEWLCFLDADDELGPGYLTAMERAIEQERGVDEAPLLLTPAVQQVRNRKRPAPPMFYREVDLQSANWLVVGTLIERDIFSRVGGFEDYQHGFEDWSLWYKSVKIGARVVRVPGAIYVLHVNPNSKHRQLWRQRSQPREHMRIQKELEAWVP